MIDYTLLTLAIALLAVTVLGKCAFMTGGSVPVSSPVFRLSAWRYWWRSQRYGWRTMACKSGCLRYWWWCLRCSCIAFCRGHAYGPCRCNQRESGQEDRCVTLMIANVLTPNRNSEGLIRQVQEHRPDVLLTLESDQWWGDQLDAALVTGRPLSACRWTTSMACICIRGCRWKRPR